MKLNFKGKTAVVTGASGGMGLETVDKLSLSEIKVLMLDIKEPPKKYLKNKFTWLSLFFLTLVSLNIDFYDF